MEIFEQLLAGSNMTLQYPPPGSNTPAVLSRSQSAPQQTNVRIPPGPC